MAEPVTVSSVSSTGPEISFSVLSTWIVYVGIVFLSVDSTEVFSDDSNNSVFLMVTGSCMLLRIIVSSACKQSSERKWAGYQLM